MAIAQRIYRVGLRRNWFYTFFVNQEGETRRHNKSTPSGVKFQFDIPTDARKHKTK
jgi:hypothetical protein